MKQKKFNKKLSLNKKTIAHLSNGEKGNVFGGGTKTCFIESVCMCPYPTIEPTCRSGCSIGNCC